MVEEGASIDESGKVTATLKYITGYTEFDSSDIAQQSGYYFPFKLVGTGTQIQVKKNGSIVKTVDWDPNWVIKITDVNDKFEFIVDGQSVITLDFTKVKLDITQDMVTQALTNAATAVNKKMNYAQLSIAGTKATCNITDSTPTITKIYTDIISTIFDELKKNATKFAKIRGAEKEITIKKDQNIDATELVTMVKALFPELQPSQSVSQIFGKTVQLTIVATDGDEFEYSLSFVDKTSRE